MLCYVNRGKSKKNRKKQYNPNKRVEMTTTTTKRSMEKTSIRPHMKKFKDLEQNKDPWIISK
jgi:hypothetical protein